MEGTIFGFWHNHRAKQAVRDNDPTYIDESSQLDRDNAYVQRCAWGLFEQRLADDEIYEAATTAAHFLDEEDVYDHVLETIEYDLVRLDPETERADRFLTMLDAFNLSPDETGFRFTDDVELTYATSMKKAEERIAADLWNDKTLDELHLDGPHFYFVDADRVRDEVERIGHDYQASLPEFEGVEESDVYAVRGIDWVKDMTTEDIRDHVEL